MEGGQGAESHAPHGPAAGQQKSVNGGGVQQCQVDSLPGVIVIYDAIRETRRSPCKPQLSASHDDAGSYGSPPPQRTFSISQDRNALIRLV